MIGRVRAIVLGLGSFSTCIENVAECRGRGEFWTDRLTDVMNNAWTGGSEEFPMRTMAAIEKKRKSIDM